MTLFTGEGLLRAWASARQHGNVPGFATAVRRSYGSWLLTQEESRHLPPLEDGTIGWLLNVEGLHRRVITQCLPEKSKYAVGSDLKATAQFGLYLLYSLDNGSIS